jgi:hypothetical protein
MSASSTGADQALNGANMKNTWERTAKIRGELLAHRFRLEQAKAGV